MKKKSKEDTWIDFHAHILPGMDHGCDNVQMSLEQLTFARKHGVDIVIATSHFYPHMETTENFLARRERARKILLENREEEIPEILMGAEVLVCHGMESMEHLEELCVEGTKVLLLEMPFSRKWEDELINTVFAIQEKCGLTVVLAHAERYSVREVKRLLDKGIKVQVNADSLWQFKRVRKVLRYIKKDYVVALGSDIHGISNSYYHYEKAMIRCGEKAEEIQRRTKLLINAGGLRGV